MRLIDADELKDRIISTADLGGWIGATLLEIKRLAIKYIDAVPTIEVIPEQKTGKWKSINGYGNVFSCSECGFVIFGREEISDFLSIMRSRYER